MGNHKKMSFKGSSEIKKFRAEIHEIEWQEKRLMKLRAVFLR